MGRRERLTTLEVTVGVDVTAVGEEQPTRRGRQRAASRNLGEKTSERKRILALGSVYLHGGALRSNSFYGRR